MTTDTEAPPDISAYWPPRLGLDNLPLPVGVPKTLEEAIRLTEYKLACPGVPMLNTARETLVLLTDAAVENEPDKGWKRWDMPEAVTPCSADVLSLLLAAARSALPA